MMDDTDTKNNGLLGTISIIMGAGGIFLHYAIIFIYMEVIMAAETEAAQECEATAAQFLTVFSIVGILAGILWLLAGVGYFQKKKWAYPMSVTAIVIALWASGWPNIPALESGTAPAPWMLIFLPNLVMYFVLLRGKGNESWGKVLVGLLGGMAYILSFINGIAGTTRMVNRFPYEELLGEAEMFMLTFANNMLASVLLGIAVIGLFVGKKKELVRIIGLAGVFLSIFAGYPLAIYSMLFMPGEPGFSPFIAAPVMSTIICIFFLSNKRWNKLVGTNPEK